MSSVNHFTTLGCEPEILINRRILEDHYVKRQRESLEDDNIQTQINRSYKILKNDVQRLNHFLEISNFEIMETIDQQSLLEFYELNEHIESLSENEKKIELQKIQVKIKELLVSISDLFKKNDKKGVNKEFIRIKYLSRIIENS